MPNSRLYHHQRNANIPVSSATTLMCSSYWSMKIWSSHWCGNHVYMYTVSSPPHLHCIIYVSNIHCWWQCWSASICCGSFHDCNHVGRLVSIVSLIVWYIAAAPLLARFDRPFVISSEYSYVRFFIVLLKLRRRWRKSYASMPVLANAMCYCFSLPSTMTTTGFLFFSFQLPGLCGSGAYISPPQTTVTVEESWTKWRQLQWHKCFEAGPIEGDTSLLRI